MVLLYSGKNRIRFGQLVILLLSEHKAKIDATNNDGATALHDAITRGNMDIIEELIKAGASTTIRATNG